MRVRGRRGLRAGWRGPDGPSGQVSTKAGNSAAGDRAGTGRELRDASRLARDYGGDPSDWVKVTSGRYRDGGGIYDLFETHSYENVRTGARYEFKTKFPRAQNVFGGPGG